MNENDNKPTLPKGSSEHGLEHADEGSILTKIDGSDAFSRQLTAKHNYRGEQQSVKEDQPVLVDGRFRIERELGRGGLGVAYLALDTHDGNKRIVIKAMLERFDDSYSAWVERHFSAEVKALSRINHPGVVKLIASGHLPYGRPYLAMEFVEGCELRSLVEPEKGLRDFERIASIIRQLGEAISAAHDLGIYHRDLKPENIIVSSVAGVELIKVIDFGIATVKESLDEKTRTTALAGSIRYMAPEQFLGKPTAATDIYALGVIAYEMITGRVPFTADLSHPLAAMQQLLELQRKGVRVLPKDLRPSLPEQAQEIILRALAYQSSARYQRADEFGRELFEALTWQDNDALVESYINRTITQEIQPKEDQFIEIEKPQATSRPVSKIMGAGVLLLLVVTLAFFAWNYSRGGARESETSNTLVPIPERVLSYYAVRSTKASGGDRTIRLTDALTSETFTKDDVLRFFITSTSDGYLYVINQEGETGNYNILFPSPRDTSKSSTITANSEVAMDDISFYGKAGTETMGLIWSASRIAELEEAIGQFANDTAQGDINSSKLKYFIRKLFESNAEITLESDPANEQMRVHSKGDLLVYLLRLQHR